MPCNVAPFLALRNFFMGNNGSDNRSERGDLKTNSELFFHDLSEWSAPKIIRLATEKTLGGLNGAPETTGLALVESGG